MLDVVLKDALCVVLTIQAVQGVQVVDGALAVQNKGAAVGGAGKTMPLGCKFVL